MSEWQMDGEAGRKDVNNLTKRLQKGKKTGWHVTQVNINAQRFLQI